MNRGLLSAVCVSLLISACATSSGLSTRDGGHAIPTVASDARSGLRKFNIPAGNATAALDEWARQGNMQVLFGAVALRDQQTHAVEGMLPPAQALRSMLKDTGLSFTPVNEKTVAVGVDRQRP